MTTPNMFYVTYSDDVHEGPIYDETTSLFDATCSFYELIPQLQSNEVGELGEFLEDEEMEGFLFSMPEDRN